MHTLIIGGGGIGQAVAQQALNQQHEVTVISRRNIGDALEGAHIITTSNWEWESVAQAFNSLPALPDRLIVATGLLWTESMQPEKRTEDLSKATLTASLQANTLLPAAVLSTLAERMTRKTALRVLVITAKVASIEDNRLGGWYAYRASKAATHMLIKCAAIEWQRRFPQVAIAAYHPGTTDSELSRPFQGRVPSKQLKTPTAAAQCLWTVLEEQVTPDQSGRFWSWDGSELPW